MSRPQLNEDAIQALMGDIHRLYSSSYYRDLKTKGIELTQAQWRILSLLALHDGRTQSELAEVMLMEKAPFGVVLDKLEAKQMIERRPDTRDRRAKRIYITDKVEPLIPIMRGVSNNITETAMQTLSDEDQQQLTRILKVMRCNLNNLRQQ
ncbi:MAG: MarR family transcriptional regulator, partial [Pseudomonadota bacterium]|nr:MarR family transcriptional regulator [Pseudomonadota bacterium]